MSLLREREREREREKDSKCVYVLEIVKIEESEE